MSKLIAIIDDNESMQDSLRDLIEAGGFEAQCFESAKAFLESDSRCRAACLIVDIRMPKMSGLELQARLKQEKHSVPIIFVTAFDDAESHSIITCCSKPCEPSSMVRRLGEPTSGCEIYPET
jgi:FixJ family two-component response regulator